MSPRRTIEEWMRDHVHTTVQPILKRLPRDEEGIRLTQCAAMSAIGWVGLLCLAWCGHGCGGREFDASPDARSETLLDTSSDAGSSETEATSSNTSSDASSPETATAGLDAGSETSRRIDSSSSDAESETDWTGAEAVFVMPDACALAPLYSCGPNGMGSGPDWWGNPPQTFCLTTDNLQRFSSATPAPCNTCETFNCACFNAQPLCRNQLCSDQGGRVSVVCGK